MFNHRHVLLTLFLVEKFSDLSTAVLHRVLTRVLVYDALSALALRTDAGSFMWSLSWVALAVSDTLGLFHLWVFMVRINSLSVLASYNSRVWSSAINDRLSMNTAFCSFISLQCKWWSLTNRRLRAVLCNVFFFFAQDLWSDTGYWMFIHGGVPFYGWLVGERGLWSHLSVDRAQLSIDRPWVPACIASHVRCSLSLDSVDTLALEVSGEVGSTLINCWIDNLVGVVVMVVCILVDDLWSWVLCLGLLQLIKPLIELYISQLLFDPPVSILASPNTVSLGASGRGACISGSESLEDIISSGGSDVSLTCLSCERFVLVRLVSLARLVWISIAPQSCFLFDDPWILKATCHWSTICWSFIPIVFICIVQRNVMHDLLWLISFVLLVVFAGQADVSSCAVDNAALRDSIVFHVLVDARNRIKPFLGLRLVLLLLFSINVINLRLQIWNVSAVELSVRLVRLVEVSGLDLLWLVALCHLLLCLVDCLGRHSIRHIHSGRAQKACGFVQRSWLITDLLSLSKLSCDRLLVYLRRVILSIIAPILVSATSASHFYIFLVVLRIIDIHWVSWSSHYLRLLDAWGVATAR